MDQASESSSNSSREDLQVFIGCLMQEAYQPTRSCEAAYHSLYGFCKTLHELPRGEVEAALSPLGLTGIPAVLQVLKSKQHYKCSVQEWALAALIWFVYGSQERATLAVDLDAVHAILDLLKMHPRRERLWSASLTCLSHLLGYSHPRATQQAITKGHFILTGEVTVSPSRCEYLVHEMLLAMESFPDSAHMYKHSCSILGRVYMLLGNASDRGGSNATAVKDLFGRLLTAIHAGFVRHCIWDKGAEEMGRSLLQILLGNQQAKVVLDAADRQLCHGGAA